jgi:hypothetical protein
VTGVSGTATCVLHLVTRLDPVVVAALDADRALGHEVHCVLLHDAVYAAGSDRAPRCDRLWVCADDRRRRGLPAGDSALEYPAIVEAMARASLVVSW